MAIANIITKLISISRKELLLCNKIDVNLKKSLMLFMFGMHIWIRNTNDKKKTTNILNGVIEEKYKLERVKSKSLNDKRERQ